MEIGNNQRSSDLRKIMESFVNDLLLSKMEGVKPESNEAQKLRSAYAFDTWIVDLADRALKSQAGKSPIKMVTHIVKGVHAKARASSLLVNRDQLTYGKPTFGVFTNGIDRGLDVIGNAAEKLNEFKLLDLAYGDDTFADLMLRRDIDLLRAIDSDIENASKVVDRLLSTIEPSIPKASNIGKQIYWLVGEDPKNGEHYHLLAPLYPTLLIHKIYRIIQEHRFGEQSKAARQARRENKFSEVGYHDYPNLAVQKLGGTKPQNISQLNSERGGNNYLLASLPPQWHSISVKAPLNSDSVFPRYTRRKEVRWLVKNLQQLLNSNPPQNIHTRRKVNALVDSLIEELIIFAAQYQVLEPGWSEQPDCRLVEEEKLWLDTGRCEQDEAFRAQRENTDWPEKMHDRFAKWVNNQLSKNLPVGDSEHHHWMKQIKNRMNSVQEVVYG